MSNPQTLYHYCSNFAFHSIILQKRVRLSLLSMSNDAKEGRHVLDIAERILPNSFRQKADALEQLRGLLSVLSAIGFCLSEDDDMLSQWRGYADDARGVAIGFDFSALEGAAKNETEGKLIVRFARVVYQDESLTQIMERDLQPVIEHYNSGKMRRRIPTILSPWQEGEQEDESERSKDAIVQLFGMLASIANYAYIVKQRFFEEEKEWRIFAAIPTHGSKLRLEHSQFMPSADCMRPFRDFPMNGFPPALVSEVIVGPRNKTPDDVLRLFLDSHGFEHVSIRRSCGSYR